MQRLSFAPPLISLAIILTLGLSTIWSTAPSLTTSQVIALVLGILAAIVISKLDAEWLYQLRWVLYAVTLILLLVTAIIGITTRGSTRWIDLGLFNFQTSEFVKPMLIVSFAAFFVDKHDNLVRHLPLIAIPTLLVFLQPDLGSAISLIIIWFGIALASKVPRKHLVLLMIFGVMLIPVGTQFLKPYQQERITSFVNPFSDPAGSGYNVIQSMIAVGNGHIIGRGIRQGTQSHLRFLPERHTDFAFASFAEEFGFLGVTILLTSFLILLNWLIGLAKSSSEFGSLVTIGLFWWIFGQLIVNIGMNMGMMPVTGITLPMVSYGGSSLLAILIGFGLVTIFAREAAEKIEI
jgi:rod shape determining protein RodA